MKKVSLKNFMMMAFSLLLVNSLSAQMVVDFESPATSPTFNGFGDAFVVSPIANPDVSGINTSPFVGEYNEPHFAQGWAGAFGDLGNPPSLDFTVYSEVCVKVWASVTGNLLFKAELPIGGGSTWEQLQDITVTNQWTELCFDGTIPDAAGGSIAIGKNFTRATLFFDFFLPNAPDPETRTWYFDDIRMQGMAPPPPMNRDITFSVNMNGFPNSFTQPYISGTFNGWSPNANPLSDPDGDNIWETTLSLPDGQIIYKFQLDGWQQQERFVIGDPCTINNAGNADRVYVVSANDVLPTYCFSTCTVCNNPNTPTVDVTFSINMNTHPDPFTTVYLSGTFNDWSQFGNPLTDINMDGIWETSLTFFEGQSLIFKYQLDGWAQQEFFTLGDPCTTNNFGNADRVYTVSTADPLPTYCYSTCDICPAIAIPTMGEWGMFLFALIMVTMGVVFVKGMQTEVGMATSQGAVPVEVRRFPFDKANYFKSIKHAFGLALVGFAFIYLVWGEIVPADLVGMSLTIPVVAYLIHLFKK